VKHSQALVLPEPHRIEPLDPGVQSLSLSTKLNSETDFSWIFDQVRLPLLERLFVSARRIDWRGVARLFSGPARLTSACWRARYAGSFPGIRILDIRDAIVEWDECEWPDLEVLILRPRGNYEDWKRTAHTIFRSPLPRVTELRFPENHGDNLVECLVGSPLLRQLRCLDCTESLRNSGAQLLCTEFQQFTHLEQVWVGTCGVDRENYERNMPDKEFPPGTFEIDDAWRNSLKSRLGERVRFDPRPGHPDL
jgi:hypothetical protein